VTGIGAGIVTVLVALLVLGTRLIKSGRRSAHRAPSSACYTACGVTFPDRPIYLYFCSDPRKCS
jgi:hypothetical protein